VRLLLAIALTAFSASAQPLHAAEPPATPNYPLWDGSETIEQYAKKAGLEPTKTLDLGNGVRLELVLIPAGKFIMGTPEPTPVDEWGLAVNFWLGLIAFTVGIAALLVLVGTVFVRAIREWRRPQYSLATLVAMTIAAGIGLLGALHWHFSALAFSGANAEHQVALARFKASYDEEKPAHEVTLTQPYYLGKFEVTQEQYQQVTGVDPSHFKGREQPVEEVSWNDAQEFCKKVSEVARSSGSRGDPEGRPTVIRLPTDAEWEHACRAGTKTTYYTGDREGELDRAAWYDKNSGGTTHPVGKKVPNAWGVHDMHGNVCEWCSDWYEDYEAGAVTDPQGPAQGQYRVLRGGSWGHLAWDCRSSYRGGDDPNNRDGYLGFRVAVSAPIREGQ
jgi:formylglycine-generating enzyme required for sulfatase activity